MQRIGILGAGAWGTALAMTARRAGRGVVLWARRPQAAAEIEHARENAAYLPGLRLPEGIRVTGEISEAATCEAVFLTVPAQHLRGIAARLAPHLAPDRPVVLCAKGIEQETGRLMSEAIAGALPRQPAAVLSGPTFAAEVARGLPTAVTLAAADAALGRALIDSIGTPAFRPYLSDDPRGAEIGGAVKNVLAIACGIVVGRRLGDNARAALITRGLAEMTRFARALGARPETLMGLSGLGDLALTCNAPQSRNFSLGIGLGEGKNLAALLAGSRSVVEGVYTAAALVARARAIGVEIPISEAVDAILNRGAAIDATIATLLARPFTAESLQQ